MDFNHEQSIFTNVLFFTIVVHTALSMYKPMDSTFLSPGLVRIRPSLKTYFYEQVKWASNELKSKCSPPGRLHRTFNILIWGGILQLHPGRALLT